MPKKTKAKIKSVTSAANAPKSTTPMPKTAGKGLLTVEQYVQAGYSVDPVDEYISAEYARKDESELIIPDATLDTELNENGAIKTRRSYAIGWTVPISGSTRGTLIQLNKFVVEVHNEGCHDVSMVWQQPHGHETSPGSLAAWVILNSRTLKAGASFAFTVSPVANEFVVPYRTNILNEDCVVVACMSAAKQALTAAGTSGMSKSEVGLRVKISSHYVSVGNSLSSGQYFAVRTDTSSDWMTKTDPPPSLPVRMVDVGTDICYARPIKAKSTYYALGFLDKNYNSKPDEHLRKDVVYRLPVPVPGYRDSKVTVGYYIKWNNAPGVNAWWIYHKPNDANINPIWEDNHEWGWAGEGATIYSPEDTLTPIPKNYVTGSAIRCKRNKCVGTPLRASQTLHLCRSQQLGGWKEDLMGAVSFVVSVIKVATAVAGAVGLMDNVLSLEDGEGEYVHVAN